MTTMQKKTLVTKAKTILTKLSSVRRYVNAVVFEREAETESALVAILSGLSVLYVGDVGAAKTLHVQELARLFGLTLFDTLLSETTKPENIFGPIDVPALASGTQRSKVQGYAPTAEVLFFDEIFKANGVVLNPLLWLLNEHKFRNGDEGVLHCPTVAVFAASNEIPTETGLRAIYDRLLIRHSVSYIKSRVNLRKFYSNIVDRTCIEEPEGLTREDVAVLRELVRYVKVPSELWEMMVTIRDDVQKLAGVKISDRRLGHCIRAVQATALLNKRLYAVSGDLSVMANMLWDDPQQFPKIRSIVMGHADAVNGDVQSYLDMAHSIHEVAITSGAIDAGISKMTRLSHTTNKFNTSIGKQIAAEIRAKLSELEAIAKTRTTFTFIELLDGAGKTWFKLPDAVAKVWSTKQLRNVGFHFSRKNGYWWSSDLKKHKLIDRIKHVLNVPKVEVIDLTCAE